MPPSKKIELASKAEGEYFKKFRKKKSDKQKSIFLGGGQISGFFNGIFGTKIRTHLKCPHLMLFSMTN